MTIAIYAGSFDPITLGHVDIVERALTIFDIVIIGIARNAGKNALFSVPQRIELATAVFASYGSRVQVKEVPGLLANFALKQHADALVRGVRNSKDYESEQPMAILNRQLCGLETVLIVGDPALSHISSSAVKELAGYGVDVTEMVPEPVVMALGRVTPNVPSAPTPAIRGAIAGDPEYE